MFLNGKTVKEIADERDYAMTTIESHLAKNIASGDLDIKKLLGEKELKIMIDYFKKAENKLLSPAREALGEKYSYRDLKYAQKYMEYLE